MIVNVNQKTYDMPRTVFQTLLSMAKEKYHKEKKHAIYCVEQHDTAIMKNDTFKTKKELYAAIKEHMNNGFRVYYIIGRDN
jgi:hypothetical protein